MAPKIDRRNLKNIVIKEGEPFMFDVKVQGEPPPEISWNLNNKEIHSNSIKQIDNEPNHTKFYHKNPERKDSGIYKIHAVNKYGSDTAEVEVTVVCKYQHCEVMIASKLMLNVRNYSYLWKTQNKSINL